MTYGNRVETGTLQDKSGRSWGSQVTDIACELQSFLKRRSVSVTVAPTVLLMHDGAGIGSHREVKVVLTLGTRNLVNQVRAAPALLSAQQRTAIESLIRQDHAHHARPRQRR